MGGSRGVDASSSRSSGSSSDVGSVISTGLVAWEEALGLGGLTDRSLVEVGAGENGGVACRLSCTFGMVKDLVFGSRREEEREPGALAKVTVDADGVDLCPPNRFEMDGK